MRPAVCSSYSSRFSTTPDSFGPHQVEHRRRQLLRQVVDQGRRVVGGNLLRELGDLFGRARGQQRGAGLGTELGDRLHGEAAVALGQQAERRFAVLVGRSLKIWARSAGCCFCSRFSRLAVAPMRSSRLTESRTRSILRCAAMVKFPSPYKRLNVARGHAFSIPGRSTAARRRCQRRHGCRRMPQPLLEEADFRSALDCHAIQSSPPDSPASNYLGLQRLLPDDLHP